VQITGRSLKVGDKVRAATSPPRPDRADREVGTMTGEVVGVLAHASSGARRNGAPPHGKVRVRWSSGSVAVHDACMIIRDAP
jgi:hypothetical protein